MAKECAVASVDEGGSATVAREGKKSFVQDARDEVVMARDWLIDWPQLH